ncbi:MAG TPA: TA system VapC family ribonuclease toxin [Gemmatimonadaceae bacterium]|nr:TA system VapC family ribonuclease toxin [Gemmatimonadaceae bacterium]
MFVVDANILVYAADAAAPEHARCRALVERLRLQSGAWYLTWNICYEFLRVATHPRVFRAPWSVAAANGFLRALQASPSLVMLLPTERHDRVLADVIAELPHLSGNLIHDAHTAVLMREHGLHRIYTRDTDFHRFPFLEPIDPLIGSG